MSFLTRLLGGMNADIEKDARKIWFRAGATIAMAEAMGKKIRTDPDSEEGLALRLSHCAAELNQKYPSLSKDEAYNAIVKAATGT